MPVKTLALFTPFELIAGGGTRYVLGIAEAFRDVYQVYLVTPSALPISAIVDVARSIGVCADHVIPLSWEHAHARSLSAPFTFAVAFGNEPLPEVPGIGERNFFVCQFPFPITLDSPLPTKKDNAALRLLYLAQHEAIVVYSEFAKDHLRARLREFSAHEKPIRVIYPAADPIPSDRWFVLRQRKSIISVGRFFDVGHGKRQDELIRAFRKLNGAGWSLHLPGAIYPGEGQQVTYEKCVRLADGMAVKFYPNASRAEIGRLYRQCTCYWHGAGLGANPATEPEKFEHFGISVVEAMAAGCLPLVVAYGGPAQIVTSGCDGWTFDTPAELVELTLRLTMLNGEQLRTMRARARERARAFTFDVFRAQWRTLLSR